MNSDELVELFEKHADLFLEDPPTTRHQRRDMAAFLLLHEIYHNDERIICGADHDRIYLEPSLETLAEAGITEEQVKELIRYGVLIHEDGLAMYA